METNNKKTTRILAVLCIAVAVICIIGFFAKKAYNRHQEEIRLQAIEIKNGEIDQEYENFEKEENREKRLKVLKNEVKNAADYEKAENAYEECSAHYAKVIAQMKNYFVSDYDNTIKSISDKVGSDVEKVEDKDALSSASTDFTSFKETLKNDYENYNTIEKDKFDEYNSTVDEYVKKYNDRVAAIEKAEEEARKKAEEEAKKKAEEEAKKKAEEEAAAKAAREEAERKAAGEAAAAKAAQESSSSSGNSSYYNDSYDNSYDNSSSYSGGSSSSGSSSSGSDYSGSNDYSGSSSSGGNSGISSGANYGWAEGSDGNRVENYYDPSTGDTWDMNGNYQGNMNDWLWD